MPVDRRKRPLVLIADDEDVIRELLRRRLAMDGYEIEVVEDGEQAVAAVGREFVNVVLSDIKMPGLDGMQVLKRTKEMSPDTEVIMMTAYAALDTAIEAVRLGAFDYLQKPFEHISDISNKVKHALRQQNLAFENRELLTKLEEMNRGLKQVVVNRTRELSEAQRALLRARREMPARLRDGLDALEARLQALGPGDGAVMGEIRRLLSGLRADAASLAELLPDEEDAPGAEE